MAISATKPCHQTLFPNPIIVKNWTVSGNLANSVKGGGIGGEWGLQLSNIFEEDKFYIIKLISKSHQTFYVIYNRPTGLPFARTYPDERCIVLWKPSQTY